VKKVDCLNLSVYFASSASFIIFKGGRAGAFSNGASGSIAPGDKAINAERTRRATRACASRPQCGLCWSSSIEKKGFYSISPYAGPPALWLEKREGERERDDRGETERYVASRTLPELSDEARGARSV